MSLYKSGNPALSEKRFTSTVLDEVATYGEGMTVKGTLNKFGFLFLVTLCSAFYTWKEVAGGGNAWPLILTGAFGGLGIAIVLAFKQQWSPYLAPAYALLEGFFVGGVSAYFEYSVPSQQDGYAGGYSGIVVQAVGLTLCVVVAMFLLYKFKLIQATKRFKTIMITAISGIGLFYLACWIMTWAGFAAPSFLFQNSPLGIGFSLFVVSIAALSLILDFDMIEKGAEMGAPKYMEWYGAFGLLVTIVWLYIEILRLLSKLRD
jgi:uncharacterized YccA/Bax inhibitor family protein